MTLSIKWIGLGRFQRRAEDAARKIPKALRERLTDGAAVIVRTGARKYFKGIRTRAFYHHSRMTASGKSHKRRKRPLAVTAPPDKLGSFTGKYLEGMGFELRRRGRGAEAILGVPREVGEYAAAHEFGLGKMPPRPVFSRAAEDKEDFLVRKLGLTFSDAFDG